MNEILYIIPRATLIGILVSAPMGPIGMLVIQRTLSKGRLAAFFTGVGAALSDLVYCLLTGLCLSFVTDLIQRNQLILQILGSIVLAIFGIYLFRKRPSRPLRSADRIPSNSYWMDFVTGFLLTFSNPLILFFIIGLFSQFNLVLSEFLVYHYISAFLFILVGAVLWWYLVTMLVDKLRAHINARSLGWINRIIGSILIVMAVIGTVMAVNSFI